jgi:cystathionine beta-lyase
MSKLKKHFLGCVNSPIYQASSIIFEKVADLKNAKRWYGRNGTETNSELEEKICKLENAKGTILYASGAEAISNILFSVLESGDHVLFSDATYMPTQNFANKILKKFGVEVDYFDCKIGKEIEKHIKKNTKLIYFESPSSITFEIQEIDKIVKVAKKKKILTAIDNTYSAGILFKPLKHGVDISLQSLSKYASGHSDIIAGSVSFREKKLYKEIWQESYLIGGRLSPADCSLILRGLKTLEVRLKQHQESALEIAKFLERDKKIMKVIYPGLESFEQKEIFDKYFTHANGLITFAFEKKVTLKKIKKFVDELQKFKIGYSWGGTESLVMFYEELGKAYEKRHDFPLVRINVGIDDKEILINDLKKALSCI